MKRSHQVLYTVALAAALAGAGAAAPALAAGQPSAAAPSGPRPSTEAKVTACEEGYAKAALTIRNAPTTRATAVGSYADGAYVCIIGAEPAGGRATACGETSTEWLEVSRGWVFEPCVLH
ncbi:hypothetical protein [Streptomyces bluensis]|uniref:hypothetical protein n=1 Tax=Streptomyces bluensis TaxID=33897 RepID=UPI00332E49AD